MEQRHGYRKTVDMGVTVQTMTGLTRSGRIHDASTSGARLEIAAALEVHSLIVLTLRAARSAPDKCLELEAEVIRRTPDGFGIEWTGFAPSLRRARARLAVGATRGDPTAVNQSP